MGRLALWALGKAKTILGWGAGLSVAGGAAGTWLSGQPMTGENLARNTVKTGKDIAGFVGDMASEVIAPTPATNGNPAGQNGGNSSPQGSDSGPESQMGSMISTLFNNFSDTKIGQALQPMMGFLRSSPIISGILTLVFGMIALSGQNSWPMRILAGALAGITAKESGILDFATQGSGRNAPGAIGGADAYAPLARQPHTGGAPVYPEDDVVTVDIGKPLDLQLGRGTDLRPEFAPG